jgi:catechol 2,3-dioxygenase-like lactoylglutathione lyase family enzyme
MQVTGLDHVVLNVSDAEVSVAFYCRHFGLEPLRMQEWRSGAAPFPSARISDECIIDFVEKERSGQNVDHICLVVEPEDLTRFADTTTLSVVEGPVTRFGARGNGTSVYVRDPDDNVVELRHYGTPHAGAPTSGR